MLERERMLAKATAMRDRAAMLEQSAGQSTADMVPEHGQPILVGHHSEKGHRRMMDRAHNVWARQANEAQQAVSLRRQADGLERRISTAIFDDDPDRDDRLRARIDFHERELVAIKASSLGPHLQRDAVTGIRRKLGALRKRLERAA